MKKIIMLLFLCMVISSFALAEEPAYLPPPDPFADTWRDSTVLYPKDAFLYYATSIVIESKAKMQNLSGWKTGSSSEANSAPQNLNGWKISSSGGASSAPQNLGGWRAGDAVMFHVPFAEAGTYEVSLLYSRNNVAPVTMGVFAFKEKRIMNPFESQAHFYTDLAATSDETWDVYARQSLGALTLPRGYFYLTFTGVGDGATFNVINLREVHLKKIQ